MSRVTCSPFLPRAYLLPGFALRAFAFSPHISALRARPPCTDADRPQPVWFTFGSTFETIVVNVMHPLFAYLGARSTASVQADHPVSQSLCWLSPAAGGPRRHRRAPGQPACRAYSPTGSVPRKPMMASATASGRSMCGWWPVSDSISIWAWGILATKVWPLDGGANASESPQMNSVGTRRRAMSSRIIR